MKNKRKRYNKFIMSKEWYEIRDRLFLERGRKCEECGSEKNIHVHHLNYKRFGGNELNEDLQILCKSCHFKLHKDKIPKTKKRPLNKDQYNNILTIYPEVMSKKVSNVERACMLQKEFGTGKKLYDKTGRYLKKRCKKYCDMVKEEYKQRIESTDDIAPDTIANNIYPDIESIYPAIMSLSVEDCDKAYIFKKIFSTKHKLRDKNKKYKKPNCLSFLSTLRDIYLYRASINGKGKAILKVDGKHIEKLVSDILNESDK